MEQPNRRKFLIIAGAGAGAAAVGVAAAKAGIAGPDAPVAGSGAAAVPAGAGPLVAYIEDAGSGRVSVMTGDAETVVHDPDLVARLSRAATGRTA
jgi:hypothetical protein